MGYCEDSDLDIRFGKTNVDKWSDLDNNGKPVSIAARRAWGIQQATDDLDEALRGCRYEFPWPELGSGESYPPGLVDTCAKLAGVILYESRGITDMDGKGNPLHRLSNVRKEAEKWIQKIWACTIKLDATELSRSYPTSIVDNGTNAFVQRIRKRDVHNDLSSLDFDNTNPFATGE